MILLDNKSTTKMAGTSTDRRITGLIKQFNEFLDCQTINKYFQLPSNSPIYKLTRDDILLCVFTSTYTKTYNISGIKLPDDILKLINTYVDQHVLIIFDIIYDTNYPFKAPKWKIQKMNASTKISKQVDQIAYDHNRAYKIDWSPSISIEKDTLYMIERLSQIDYI